MNKEERKRYIQTGMLILWKEEASEEDRQNALSEFYQNNESKIKSMQLFEMKKGVDIYDKYKKFKDECQ